MASRRTQIYLDDELRARVDRVAAREDRAMAEIIRDALDRYLEADERARRPLAEIASEVVGAWAGENSHLPELRGELAERSKRLGY